jgi:hypothetical protein
MGSFEPEGGGRLSGSIVNMTRVDGYNTIDLSLLDLRPLARPVAEVIDQLRDASHRMTILFEPEDVASEPAIFGALV